MLRQVRVLEAGHPWCGPHTGAEVRGWCLSLTHPYYGEWRELARQTVLLILSRALPLINAHYTQCSLETWVLVTLSRHCPDGEVTTGQERARPGVLCGPGHSARCSHECQALSCELVVTEGGRVQSELHAPIMLSRTLSPSALLLTLSQLSHLASGARDTGANVPSDLVTGRTIWL